MYGNHGWNVRCFDNVSGRLVFLFLGVFISIWSVTQLFYSSTRDCFRCVASDSAYVTSVPTLRLPVGAHMVVTRVLFTFFLFCVAKVKLVHVHLHDTFDRARHKPVHVIFLCLATRLAAR